MLFGCLACVYAFGRLDFRRSLVSGNRAYAFGCFARVCLNISLPFIQLLRSAHTMGLVPATSPCNKSQGLVASCELASFAKKSGRRDQILVPATSPTNSNWFELVGLVAETKVGPCD